MIFISIETPLDSYIQFRLIILKYNVFENRLYNSCQAYV